MVVAGIQLSARSRRPEASHCPVPMTNPVTAPPSAAASGLSTGPAMAPPAMPASGKERNPRVQMAQLRSAETLREVSMAMMFQTPLTMLEAVIG